MRTAGSPALYFTAGRLKDSHSQCKLGPMSVFSDEFNPISWLREKTLLALQTAASLVDVANEPDTTPWYKRKLLSSAEHLIDRLLPVVAYLHQTESAAVDREEWGDILEGGSFSLAKWCKKWKVADPTSIGRSSLRHLRTVEETEEKAQELPQELFEGDLERVLDMKLQIYSYMSRRLAQGQFSNEAQRIMLWLLGSLWVSDPADVVTISKRFLPTDIDITPEQASSGYRELYEKGFVERVEHNSEQRPDRLSLRLVVEGLNDSRHAPEYKDETFGYPGARIGGKLTFGQGKLLQLPDIFTAMLNRWFKEDQELNELCNFLQRTIGEDRIYIERAEVKIRNEKPRLLLYFRYPLDAELEPLEVELSEHAEEWFKNRVV